MIIDTYYIFKISVSPKELDKNVIQTIKKIIIDTNINTSLNKTGIILEIGDPETIQNKKICIDNGILIFEAKCKIKLYIPTVDEIETVKVKNIGPEGIIVTNSHTDMFCDYIDLKHRQEIQVRIKKVRWISNKAIVLAEVI